MPWTNEIFYYGIVAIDEEGNRGEISNLVAVYIHEETTTTLPTTSTRRTTRRPVRVQTANRRLGVVGDEDEILSDAPSVFRIITGKKTLPTVIPYLKKQDSEEVGIARNKRPRVFLPTVRGGSSRSPSSDGSRHSNKRTELPRWVESTIYNKNINYVSYAFLSHIFSAPL